VNIIQVNSTINNMKDPNEINIKVSFGGTEGDRSIRKISTATSPDPPGFIGDEGDKDSASSSFPMPPSGEIVESVSQVSIGIGPPVPTDPDSAAQGDLNTGPPMNGGQHSIASSQGSIAPPSIEAEVASAAKPTKSKRSK